MPPDNIEAILVIVQSIQRVVHIRIMIGWNQESNIHTSRHIGLLTQYATVVQRLGDMKSIKSMKSRVVMSHRVHFDHEHHRI